MREPIINIIKNKEYYEKVFILRNGSHPISQLH